VTDDGRPTPADPCLGCGASTAPGSVRFAERHTVNASDGDAFLCAECHASLTTMRGDRPVTEDEVRRLVESGAAVGLLWGGGGPGIG